MSNKDPKKELEKLKQYEKNNETLAKYKSPLVFENSDSPHASIVIKNIVDYSNHEVLIYDRDLSGDLSSSANIEENSNNSEVERSLKEFKNNKKKELLQSFRRHLEQGKNLYIVVDQITDDESNTYKKLEEWTEEFPFFLSVTKATEKFKEAITQLEDSERRKVSYMAIGDLTSYRIQVRKEGDKGNSLERSAFVCYNDPETARKLGKTFKENLSSNSIFKPKAKTA